MYVHHISHSINVHVIMWFAQVQLDAVLVAVTVIEVEGL